MAQVVLNNSGDPQFGVTNRFVRSHLDVYNGNIHLDSGYGVTFRSVDDRYGSIVVDDDPDLAIFMHADANYLTPIFSVSSTGNVGINVTPDVRYDVMLGAPIGSDVVSMEVHSDALVTQGIVLDVSDGQIELLHEIDHDFSISKVGGPTLTFDQDGNIGVNDADPDQVLSVSTTMRLNNQSGLYVNNANNESVPIMLPDSSDALTVYSSNNINLVYDSDQTILNIAKDGVGVGGALDHVIDNALVNFQVYGTMNTNELMTDQTGNIVFPLMIKNELNTMESRMVDTIFINSDSGLLLEGQGTISSPALISMGYFYDRIRLPNDDIFVATGNQSLDLVGRGILIESMDYDTQNISDDMDMDLLSFSDALLGGGEINGDLVIHGTLTAAQFFGDGSQITDIPFRWQYVTENEIIYYTSGNVGIGLSDPKNYDLEVSGDVYIEETVITNNFITDAILSTQNLSIFANQHVTLNANSIVFSMYHEDELNIDYEEVMRLNQINMGTQWLIGTQNSSAEFHVLSDGPQSEVRLQSSSFSLLDLVTSQASMNIRFDSTGLDFDTVYNDPNFLLNASHDFGFYTNHSVLSMMIKQVGHVGVFESSPLNTLDISGNVSIGFADQGPDNGLVINGRLGIGLIDPSHEVEVSGSVLIGANQTLLQQHVSENVFYLSDFGINKAINVRGAAMGAERLFASGNIFIASEDNVGSLVMRHNITDNIVIQNNEQPQVDLIEQVNENLSIGFVGGNQVNIRDYNEFDILTVGNASVLGVGVSPNSTVHVQDINADLAASILLEAPDEAIFKFTHSNSKIGSCWL